MASRLAVWGLALLFLLWGGSTRRLHADGINLLIGDTALFARFGAAPPADLSATDRTRLHLEFVLALLGARPDAALDGRTRAARRTQLERLRAYVARGEFPRNDGHPDQYRPVFIDDRGRLCAVAYLFALDRGIEEARRIAGSHKYDFVAEIEDDALSAWSKASGLTRVELALIQPAYPSVVSRRHPAPPITLDRPDGESHVGLLTAPEVGGRPGGLVAMQLDAEWLGLVVRGEDEGTGFGFGPYVQAGVAVPTRGASTFSNVDLGVVHVSEHPNWGRLIARAGAILPTAPGGTEAEATNARAVPARVADASLRLPRTTGARFSLSPLMILDWLPYDTLGAPNYIVIRLDGGTDIYAREGEPTRAAPRLNAAVGAMYPGGAFYLESATTYIALPLAEPAFHSTLAGSLRLRWNRGRWYSPFEAGLGAVVPLTPELQGMSLLFDVRITLGPATRFECC